MFVNNKFNPYTKKYYCSKQYTHVINYETLKVDPPIKNLEKYFINIAEPCFTLPLIDIFSHSAIEPYYEYFDSFKRHCPKDGELPLLYSVLISKAKKYYWPKHWSDMNNVTYIIVDILPNNEEIETSSNKPIKNFKINDNIEQFNMSYVFWPEFEPELGRKYFFLEQGGNIVQLQTFIE